MLPAQVEHQLKSLLHGVSLALKAASGKVSEGVIDHANALIMQGMKPGHPLDEQRYECTQALNEIKHALAALGDGKQPRSADLLAADVLVRRGQRVTLVAMAGGIEVRAAGEAVADAGPDGRVRVLNLSSRRVVEGRAEAGDRVRVSL